MKVLDGELRRKLIVDKLKSTDKPLKATHIAKELGVSRQSIVGDIALIRAAGHEVIATSQGYLPIGNIAKTLATDFICVHTKDETRAELELIIKNGGEVVDVRVQHPLYGELVGNLYIRNMEDVEEFIQKTEEYDSPFLLSMTGGLHTHRVTAKTQITLDKIREALSEAGFLYEEQ